MTTLHVRHSTSFAYSRPVHASYNETRLRPAALAGQRVLESSLEVTPLSWHGEYRDYWGTRVDMLEVITPHESLTVVADARVERDDAPQRVVGCDWSALRAPALEDRMSELLMPTATTAPDPTLVELAHEQARGLDVHQAATAVCDGLRDQMGYVHGVTGVHTRAAEAWQTRKGVCQDIAHLAVGALRSLGIPARYVSGYLHPLAGAEPGRPAVGQSHAWVEFWSGEWFGYDPTNGIEVGPNHVVVARGREYGDVTPLRGVYSGGGAASQRVEVLITIVG
ncbi:transglutaminase N-terminal domain-containing protein [Georgenia sp. AZ-5]|uniref:transglutaminase family protein n=1 Tax=Georgenia sp. AZ-5 TaxID=3367526 RepID=UPI0037542D52